VALQRVSVAHSDQRQLEHTDAILEREAFKRGCRDPLEVTYYKDRDEGWKSEKTGLVPIRQVGRTQCDHQQLEGNEAIIDREALQGGFGGPLEPRSHAVTIPVVQEKR